LSVPPPRLTERPSFDIAGRWVDAEAGDASTMDARE
jgi:hypothetical protein